MFCHKCGNQLPEDSEFCTKCGAKMMSADTAPQTQCTHVKTSEPREVGIDNKTTPPYIQNTQVDIPQKKKSKKLIIIIGAVALVFGVIIIAAISGDMQKSGEQAQRDEEYIASQKQSLDTAEIPDSKQKETGETASFTDEDALKTAQKFIDEHPLYLRTITGAVDYEPTDTEYDYDITGLYRIGLVTDEGDYRTMWVSRETGEVFISADGSSLLTGEEYYVTVNINQALSESGFQRSDYFSGVTYMDLLRYSDNYYSSKLYFPMQVVTEVIEPKVYLVKGENFSGNDGKFLIIDDRNNTGANAVKGDRVAVYGTLNEIGTVNFTDGRNEQVPKISADRFIVNTLLPDDISDFTQGIVATMNNQPKAFGYGSSYSGDSSAQLVVGCQCIETTPGTYKTNIQILDGSKYLQNVDGYMVIIEPKGSSDIPAPINNGIEVSTTGLEFTPIKMNGYFTTLEQNPIGPYLITAKFVVTGFEAY